MLQARGTGDGIGGSRCPVLVPDHAGILRMVDEGIAVVLIFRIDDIVAVDLLLTDGILFVPAEQHLHGPVLDDRLIGHVAGIPVAVLTVIAHAHVEESAGDVAFILVDGLEYFVGIARCLAGAQLRAVAGGIAGGAYFAIGIAGAAVVDIAVGGINVEEVAPGGGLLVEPALRPGMLAVPAVALLLIRAALAAIRTPLLVGIDIDDLAVGVAVGVGIGIEQAVVAHLCMPFNNIV